MPPREVFLTRSGHGVKAEAVRRRYIETRYRLLPYFYSLADEASRTGLPLMRPVFLEFPEIYAPNSPGFDSVDTGYSRAELTDCASAVRRDGE